VAAPPEHLSIGEVLATLRDEFPDITISKIRFLESQGLIDPERTPSGYRKFYSEDIDRLRWILHQQKEHFLPLKVIKERLEETPAGALPSDEPAATAAASSTASSGSAASRGGGATGAKAAAKKARATKRSGAKPVRKAAEEPPLPLDSEEPDRLEPDDGDGGITRTELAEAAELTLAQVNELEEYGLIKPAAGGGDKVLFGDDAVTIAKLCAAFRRHGIEARHLRMYRAFAERESGLYGQVVLPVLRQRNPEARAKARADLIELAQMGRELRTAFLRDAVRGLLAD
jgi:DNA-binding transcriptional MerR regulator